uniref:Proteasome subunit alpha type-2-like n=1 Tax=Sinocyclocheilus grahami TaxID=75366 RepID=A0A672KBT5_SINGR
MGPDYRVLVRRARKLAQQYFLVYQEPIPTGQLVQRVASVMQEYTQSGGVRPFGVSLLIAGWDEDRPYLFQSDPSGAYFAWKATAMGKNYVNGKTFLEKRYRSNTLFEFIVVYKMEMILQKIYSVALYNFITDIMKIWNLKTLYTLPS